MIRYIVKFLDTGNEQSANADELALLRRWQIPVKVLSMFLDLSGALEA